MNAILREEYEAPVLTNDAIEVHLNYLRSGFDAMQLAVVGLRDKIDHVSAKLDSKFEQANTERAAGDVSLGTKIDRANADRAAGDTALMGKIDAGDAALLAKIDAGDAALLARIDAVNVSLSEKIDQANADRAAGDTALSAKIDALNTSLSEKIEKVDARLDQKIGKLDERLTDVQADVKGQKWFVSSVTIITSGLSIAHTFGWI